MHAEGEFCVRAVGEAQGVAVHRVIRYDRDIDMGYRYGISIWDIDMGYRYGISIWDIDMGYRYGISIWDIYMGYLVTLAVQVETRLCTHGI